MADKPDDITREEMLEKTTGNTSITGVVDPQAKKKEEMLQTKKEEVSQTIATPFLLNNAPSSPASGDYRQVQESTRPSCSPPGVVNWGNGHACKGGKVYHKCATGLSRFTSSLSSESV